MKLTDFSQIKTDLNRRAPRHICKQYLHSTTNNSS